MNKLDIINKFMDAISGEVETKVEAPIAEEMGTEAPKETTTPETTPTEAPETTTTPEAQVETTPLTAEEVALELLGQQEVVEGITEKVVEEQVEAQLDPVLGKLAIYESCMDNGITDKKVIDGIVAMYELNDPTVFIETIATMLKEQPKPGEIVTSTNVQTTSTQKKPVKKRLY